MSPRFPAPQSLLETHDSVASKNYETPPPSPCSFMDAALNNQPVPPDAVRMVGIRKVSGEHLVSRPAEWDHLCFWQRRAALPARSGSQRLGSLGKTSQIYGASWGQNWCD